MELKEKVFEILRYTRLGFEEAKDPTDEICSIPELERLQKYIPIEKELNKAMEKHPNWPSDINKQFVIVQEELGEVAKAVLHYQDENGAFEDVRDELIQTAAMCIRMLEYIKYE